MTGNERLTSKSILVLIAGGVSGGAEELPFLSAWAALWAPPLAHALVSGSINGRKQISSRSIPLLIKIVGGQTRRHDASHAFSFLLDEIHAQRYHKFDIKEQVESYAAESEKQLDRILWAKLEASIIL
jgi:hypothetical protein